MKRTLVYLAAFTLLTGMALPALAQDAKATPKATAKADTSQAVPADRAAVAKLRAEIHRTVAALIETQAAEKPDAAQVKALTEKLQSLRTQVQAQQPAGFAPGMGRGRGTGFGPAWACGPGWGGGMGRGPGYGRGPGGARGPGYGRGAGLGAGAGWGAGFVDEDKDGVCDRYQAIRGNR